MRALKDRWWITQTWEALQVVCTRQEAASTRSTETQLEGTHLSKAHSLTTLSPIDIVPSTHRLKKLRQWQTSYSNISSITPSSMPRMSRRSLLSWKWHTRRSLLPQIAYLQTTFNNIWTNLDLNCVSSKFVLTHSQETLKTCSRNVTIKRFVKPSRIGNKQWYLLSTKSNSSKLNIVRFKTKKCATASMCKT